MKQASRRVRRMGRHHNMRKGSGLNLVSLMDIFTILVFFLLVNSSSAPQLPNQKDLALPTSTAQKTPKETLVLVITADRILLQGREVARVQSLIDNETEVIEPLKEALVFQRGNRRLAAAAVEGESPAGDAITIMGDQNISYELLRKILATLQQANYTEIAFAAQQKAKSKTENLSGK